MKNSYTKVIENDNKQFIKYIFGNSTNAYNKNESEAPEGKIESKA